MILFHHLSSLTYFFFYCPLFLKNCSEGVNARDRERFPESSLIFPLPPLAWFVSKREGKQEKWHLQWVYFSQLTVVSILSLDMLNGLDIDLLYHQVESISSFPKY